VDIGLSDLIADHGELWCRPWELAVRARHRVVVALDIAEMGVPHVKELVNIAGRPGGLATKQALVMECQYGP
jgi:hypothetical protein